jgi:subtilisin family serine protease
VTVSFGRPALFRVLATFVAACLLDVFASQMLFAQSAKAGVRVFPGEYIVTFPKEQRTVRLRYREGARRIARETFLLDIARSARMRDAGSQRVSVPMDPHDTFCKDLISRGEVASCSPNYEVRVDTATAPNDPMISSLWGLSNESGVGAQRAWGVSTGSSDVVVAVIDTGIDYTHPDLRANIWTNPGEIPGNGIDDDGNGYVDDMHGINAMYGATSRGDPMDDNGHGTHVAGTIGAVGDNGRGVVGINHTVKLVGLKFLGASGSGSLSDAITAIDYMIDLKNRGANVRVVNNSWGGGGYAAALAEAIQRAEQAGIVFVAAAGNEGTDNDVEPSYPGNFEFDNIVSVAAIDEEGNLASFSNYGATTVDIAAPGVGIDSTYPGNRYARLSGTSMATPHVTGGLALLFASEPTLTWQEALARLYLSGRERGALYDGARRVPLVRTQRSMDVGRMLFGETAPLPEGGEQEPECGYEMSASNLASDGRLDTSADGQPIVQRSDEGEFYRLDLPFAFPFYNGIVSTLYVSPNGVVYVNPPSTIDFEVGRQAPLQSIAAFHSDMTPLSPAHGVRISRASDRVTILWEEGLFAAQDSQGTVKVRLTLHSSGEIENSIEFVGAEDGVLPRLALGDPFRVPASVPAGLIGISGASLKFSSVLDISESLRSLVSSMDQRLILGASMKPRCKDGVVLTTVNSIRLKKVPSKGPTTTTKVRGTVVGQGSGNVPISVVLNSFQCSGAKAIPLDGGRVTFRAVIPRGPSRFEASSGSARGAVQLRSGQTASGRGRGQGGRVGERMCRSIFRSIRVLPSS